MRRGRRRRRNGTLHIFLSSRFVVSDSPKLPQVVHISHEEMRDTISLEAVPWQRDVEKAGGAGGSYPASVSEQEESDLCFRYRCAQGWTQGRTQSWTQSWAWSSLATSLSRASDWCPATGKRRRHSYKAITLKCARDYSGQRHRNIHSSSNRYSTRPAASYKAPSHSWTSRNVLGF